MQAGEGLFSPKSGRRLAAKTPEKRQPESAPDDAQAAQLERTRPDKATLTRPEEDRRRRTILIEKLQGSFGFTIQSYGIQYRRDTEVEIITYIDHVEQGGPAAKAGMREGDVILCINGQDMEQYDHQALVGFIKQCPDRLRMVVLFEDCVRKVSLHMRYIQLQRQLTDRMYALEQLCEQEKHFIASLRAQGRRVPAFYPAQAGYGGRASASQLPHGPPPSYAEALLLDGGFPALHRARAKAAKSAESLLAPGSEFDTSCFSCDCLRTFPGEPRRPFTKPNVDSIRREKRRSSLKLGRRGSRSALVPGDDSSERSERV
ncbi:general receptor for phosphoinositides 1-associated scaffold protein-like [Pollicipes pollicipes]|uniref:general receptor for phosphoinositides 1-associated scaffold protein-like n=1 Tax=Pollicipes pollicipes TaxID=41117 RepID=UPI001884CD9E|nr:general receptor for phosphoinositides 1-associated scaffold protein-like [Pollicipes pollicipes]